MNILNPQNINSYSRRCYPVKAYLEVENPSKYNEHLLGNGKRRRDSIAVVDESDK
jgi:hypothetical protein